MKRLLLFMALVVGVVIILSSCQKEDIGDGADAVDDIAADCSTALFVPDDSSLPISKTPFFRKEDSVIFISESFDFDEANVYRTLKIRNASGTIMQEWFYEDLHETCLMPYHCQPGDPQGLIHGYYYKWENCLSNADFTDLIYNFNYEPENGFRVPDESDIRNLKKLIGSMDLLPSILNLDFDGAYHYAPDYCSKYADYWTNTDSPNKIPGCGVHYHWCKNNDPYPCGISFTNCKELGVNVRLVRNISKERW